MPALAEGDAVGLTLALAVFLLVGLVDNDLYDRYLYIPAALILSHDLIARKERAERDDDESFQPRLCPARDR